MPDTSPEPPVTALVRLERSDDAVLRVLSLCHRRGWSPDAIRCSTHGATIDLTLRLTGAAGRCTPPRVALQLERLVGVLAVVAEACEGLPEDVALGSVRRRAAWARL